MDQKDTDHATAIAVLAETVTQLQQELATEHAQNVFLSSQLRQQRDVVRDLTHQLQQPPPQPPQQPPQQPQQRHTQQTHAHHAHVHQPPLPSPPQQHTPPRRQQPPSSQPRSESGLSSPLRIQPYHMTSPSTEPLSVVSRHAKIVIEDTPFSPVLTDYLRTESSQNATVVEQETEQEVSFASAGSEEMMSNLHVPLLPLHETFSWNEGGSRPLPSSLMQMMNMSSDKGSWHEGKEGNEERLKVVGTVERIAGIEGNDHDEGSERVMSHDIDLTQHKPPPSQQQQQPLSPSPSQPPPHQLSSSHQQQPLSPSPSLNHGMNTDQSFLHHPTTVPPSNSKEKNWTKRKTSFAVTIPTTPSGTSAIEESLSVVTTVTTPTSGRSSEQDFIPPSCGK